MKLIKDKQIIFTDDNKVIGHMKLKSGEVIHFTIDEKGSIQNNGNKETDKVVLPFLTNFVDNIYYSTE